MELDAVNWKFAMLQSHDFSLIGLGRNLETIRQRLATYDERMACAARRLAIPLVPLSLD